LNYIKSLIEIIANHRAETYVEKVLHDLKRDKSSTYNNYEELLINAEANIRNLIKTQHQYKLQNDCLKAKIDEIEKSRNVLKYELGRLIEVSY
jgi:hypothetical protein